MLNMWRQQQAVETIELFAIVGILPGLEVRRSQIAAIQDAGYPTRRFGSFHAFAKNALPDPGADQLPPITGPDVGTLPDVLLDRFLGQLAVHRHADPRLALLDLPAQQPP